MKTYFKYNDYFQLIKEDNFNKSKNALPFVVNKSKKTKKKKGKKK